MYDWLTEHKIPLGSWVKSFVDLLNDHAQSVFDFISLVIGTGDRRAHGASPRRAAPRPDRALRRAPPISCTARSASRVFALLALLLVANLGYWQATIETLSLVICATLVCVLIGVPLGIAAAHRPWLYTALRPILDLMQTIPTFVYLIPTLVLFGLGTVPGLISTVIFALPAPIRLTHLGISSVPTQLFEAGKAFGATKRQLLFKVELPHALPTIMAGVTQCIMLSLSMVVIAALVGADGLGKPVVRALNTVNIAMGFEAGAAIVVLAIVLDRVCKAPARRPRRA